MKTQIQNLIALVYLGSTVLCRLKHLQSLNYSAVLLYSFYFLSACNSTQRVLISEIYASNQCGFQGHAFSIIKTKKQLQEVVNKSTPAFTPQPTIPEVNFSQNIAILISGGQKSSSGYSIKLTDTHASLRGETLHLPIKFHTPDKKRFHAQLISSPCLIISVPEDNYKKIMIENQENFKLAL